MSVCYCPSAALQTKHNLSFWRKWGLVKCSRPGPPLYLSVGHNDLLEAGNGSGVAENLAWFSLQSDCPRKEGLSQFL